MAEVRGDLVLLKHHLDDQAHASVVQLHLGVVLLDVLLDGGDGASRLILQLDDGLKDELLVRNGRLLLCLLGLFGSRTHNSGFNV